MEQELTVEELIALVNAKGEDFIIQIGLEEKADGERNENDSRNCG